MTTTQELAEFVRSVSADQFTTATRSELKKRVLDTIGIGMAALGDDPPAIVYETVRQTGGGESLLWGRGESAALPGAAMHNTALTRYLDYMDSFLAPGETPHPSDNVASLLAVGESVGASGEDLLAGLGVAYEVQGELAWNAPVRDRGWDHVTHTVISVAAGAASLLDLEHDAIRDAIGIAGTAHNALRVTRTGGINEWKGIAAANAARNGVYACLLASNGMEGPKNLFEGQKGWKQILSGDFAVDLDPGCSRVHDTMTKKYVAETYAQSAVEGVIELAETHDIDPETVDAIHLETFHGAKLIIGGGEGSRYEVETKAQADHSLPYMLAAALIDREMSTAQYDPDRIRHEDVQRLLRAVEVTEDQAFTRRFEAGEMPARLAITTADGTTYDIEKAAFEGHPNDPMSWEQLEAKFHDTAGRHLGPGRRNDVLAEVHDLEDIDVAEFVALLA